MSNLIRGVLLIVMFSSTITACGKLTVSDREQQFKVVSVYEGMANYVEAAHSDPDADLDDLFQKHVIEAYWNECAEGGEYISLADAAFEDPIVDLDNLEEEIETLRNSGIEAIVMEALEQASALLDGPDTTVCIAALDPENSFVKNSMNGVAGRTLGSGKILIQVSLQDDWEDWVSYTIAHEYHHSVWTSLYLDIGEGNDLLSYLVFEGRADTFADLVYPDFEAPWVDALSPEQEADQWHQYMEPQLSTTNPVIKQRLMFGDRRSVPLWSGYSIGYHIVQSYLELNPETTIGQLTGMDAWEIFEASGYSGDS
jgi:uncharacterized protein YjaZ